MANISGFIIDYALSDLNEHDGITIIGTFTTSGNGWVHNADDIYMQVNEGGVIKTLDGVFTFDFENKTFSFFTTQQQLYAIDVVRGDSVQFMFTDKNGPGNYDDVVLTTTPITPVCFYPGTRVATVNGEMPVESLKIGDMVIRKDGSAAPIRWVGRNTVCMTFADKQKFLPIRIKKDALDHNVPAQDLLVSAGHAILVDDILVQAGALVNHTSIVRETSVPNVFVYYHVELADHSLIMAENTPSETFINNVDRMAFDNWAEREELHGDYLDLAEMALPRAKSHRQVPLAIRDRLACRASELGYGVVVAA